MKSCTFLNASFSADSAIIATCGKTQLFRLKTEKAAAFAAAAKKRSSLRSGFVVRRICGISLTKIRSESTCYSLMRELRLSTQHLHARYTKCTCRSLARTVLFPSIKGATTHDTQPDAKTILSRRSCLHQAVAGGLRPLRLQQQVSLATPQTHPAG